MVRVQDQQLCREESPQHCHQCFPKIPAADFFLRKRFTEYHLSLVDMFVAPSRFLCERYLEWGIPAEKIRVEEYGRLEARQAAPVCRPGPKNRFGFFGQCTMFKGVDVLLKAMKLVAEEEEQRHVPPAQNSIAESGINGHAAAPAPRLHLTIHAANLELQPQTFQKEIKALVEACQRNVTWIGRYEHADLPELMANIDWVVVPSIWWENSPLVIQEAFQHGKPVICSNVGGMAEKVADGVNGLHFRVADSASLAHTLLTAAGSPELWHKLREGIPPVYRMDEHFAVMTRMYQELLDRHSGNHVQPCRG